MKRNYLIAAGFATAVIVAAVVGGVVGSRHPNQNLAASSPQTANAASSAASLSSTTATGTSTSRAATATLAPSAPTATAATFLTARAWDWSTDKSIGICLGNWLVLERYMNEDWWIQQGGENVYDEWSLTALLGNQAQKVLSDHWNSWIVESDIEIMRTAGINTLRIPMGYWAWIPTTAGEPYLAQAGQIQQFERILGYASARGMYTVIDLHGLPGSQNGEESSGHNTTQPSWFSNPPNQARSDQLVVTVMNYIATSPYRAFISGLEVINEPRPYTPAQNQELSDYYARSYTTIQNSVWPVPMFLHPGFLGLAYWTTFAEQRATVPASLMIEDHPYPGNFPIQFNAQSMLQQICTAANSYRKYPIPVVITEWSTYTGITDPSFESQFYQSQATAWAFSAGGMFWSYKLIPSALQTSASLNYLGYSFQHLISTGSVPPSTTTTANLTTQKNYLAGFESGCGVAPGDSAPFNGGNFTTGAWAGVAKQAAAGAGGKRMVRRVQD